MDRKRRVDDTWSKRQTPRYQGQCARRMRFGTCTAVRVEAVKSQTPGLSNQQANTGPVGPIEND